MNKFKKMTLSSILTREEMHRINGKGCYEHYKCPNGYITKVCGQKPTTSGCVLVGTTIDGRNPE